MFRAMFGAPRSAVPSAQGSRTAGPGTGGRSALAHWMAGGLGEGPGTITWAGGGRLSDLSGNEGGAR